MTKVTVRYISWRLLGASVFARPSVPEVTLFGFIVGLKPELVGKVTCSLDSAQS